MPSSDTRGGSRGRSPSGRRHQSQSGPAPAQTQARDKGRCSTAAAVVAASSAPPRPSSRSRRRKRRRKRSAESRAQRRDGKYPVSAAAACSASGSSALPLSLRGLVEYEDVSSQSENFGFSPASSAGRRAERSRDKERRRRDKGKESSRSRADGKAKSKSRSRNKAGAAAEQPAQSDKEARGGRGSHRTDKETPAAYREPPPRAYREADWEAPRAYRTSTSPGPRSPPYREQSPYGTSVPCYPQAYGATSGHSPSRPPTFELYSPPPPLFAFKPLYSSRESALHAGYTGRSPSPYPTSRRRSPSFSRHLSPYDYGGLSPAPYSSSSRRRSSSPYSRSPELRRPKSRSRSPYHSRRSRSRSKHRVSRSRSRQSSISPNSLTYKTSLAAELSKHKKARAVEAAKNNAKTSNALTVTTAKASSNASSTTTTAHTSQTKDTREANKLKSERVTVSPLDTGIQVTVKSEKPKVKVTTQEVKTDLDSNTDKKEATPTNIGAKIPKAQPLKVELTTPKEKLKQAVPNEIAKEREKNPTLQTSALPSLPLLPVLTKEGHEEVSSPKDGFITKIIKKDPERKTRHLLTDLPLPPELPGSDLPSPKTPEEKKTPVQSQIKKRPKICGPRHGETVIAEIDWGKRCVDKFDIIGIIGEGTYGQVYKAKDKDAGDMVALKKVRLDNEKEGFPITAIREIKILRQLHHSSIINMKEIVTDKEDALDFKKDKGMDDSRNNTPQGLQLSQHKTQGNSSIGIGSKCTGQPLNQNDLAILLNLLRSKNSLSLAHLAQILNIKVNPETQQQLSTVNLPAGVLAAAAKQQQELEKPQVTSTLTVQPPPPVTQPTLKGEPDATQAAIQSTLAVLLAQLIKTPQPKEKEIVAEAESTATEIEPPAQLPEPLDPPDPVAATLDFNDDSARQSDLSIPEQSPVHEHPRILPPDQRPPEPPEPPPTSADGNFQTEEQHSAVPCSTSDPTAGVKAALLELLAHHQAQELGQTSLDYRASGNLRTAADYGDGFGTSCTSNNFNTDGYTSRLGSGGGRGTFLGSADAPSHSLLDNVSSTFSAPSSLASSAHLHSGYSDAFSSSVTGYGEGISYLSSSAMQFTGDKDHRFEYSRGALPLLGSSGSNPAAITESTNSANVPLAAKLQNYGYVANRQENLATSGHLHGQNWGSPGRGTGYSHAYSGRISTSTIGGRGRGLPY
ncbi:cyclin-dependent kinase 13-like [Rhincodon typus]|uniref:cyclin-dependent kinase 13-like n=1 Tax=Rhincodon typus TaxID=259920 RepID=UPI00202FA61E|nr:cyclin-dependent kinase 13-like [Rhincodon typus]